MADFRNGEQYTRADIRTHLAPPVQQGGNWATGYHQHDGEWFLFRNVGTAGRTGRLQQPPDRGGPILARHDRLAPASIPSMLARGSPYQRRHPCESERKSLLVVLPSAWESWMIAFFAMIPWMFGLAATRTDSVTIKSIDRDQGLIARVDGIMGEGGVIICPSFVLYGAAAVVAECDKREVPVVSLLVDTGSGLARLRTQEEVPASPPVSASDSRALLGEYVWAAATEERSQTLASARIVGMTRDGLDQKIRLWPLNQALHGFIFLNKQGLLAAYVSEPLVCATTGEGVVLAARPESVRALIIDQRPDIPMSKWASTHGSSENATAVRILLEAQTPADVRRSIEQAKATNPDWGAALDVGMINLLTSVLISERAWGIADDLATYALRRATTPEEMAAARLRSGIMQGIRGLSTLNDLKQFVRGGDSTLPDNGARLVPLARLYLASILAQRGDAAASEEFRILAEESPWDPAVLRAMMSLLARNNDKKGFYDVATRLQEFDWTPNGSLLAAAQLVEWGALQAAKSFLQTAVERWPEDPDVLYVQAQWHRANRDLEKAESILESLLRGRRSEAAATLLWEVLESRGDEHRLMQFAEKWQALSTTEAARIVPAGWLIRRGRNADALKMLESGATTLSRSPGFASVYAGLLQRANRQEDAKRIASIAAAANPHSIEIWVVVAALAEERGDWEDCIAACQQLFRIDGLNQAAMAFLARAYHERGETDLLESIMAQLERYSPSRAAELREGWTGKH